MNSQRLLLLITLCPHVLEAECGESRRGNKQAEIMRDDSAKNICVLVKVTAKREPFAIKVSITDGVKVLHDGLEE